MEVSRVSHGPLKACDAKRRVLSPDVISPLAVRDHGPIGSTAAFFNESMRRDAMIGVMIAQALLIVDRYQHSRISLVAERK